MRLRLTGVFGLIVLGVATVGPVGAQQYFGGPVEAQPYFGDPWSNGPACPVSCGPKWTATADALLMPRSGASPFVLARHSVEGEIGPVLLNAGDMDFAYEVGTRLSLVRHFESRWEIEVGYMGFENWNIHGDIVGPAFLLPLLEQGGFLFDLQEGEPGTVDYGARFHSGEVNLRRSLEKTLLFDCFTLLAGFRMIEFQETFGAFGAEHSQAGTDWFTAMSRTSNQLYGFQIGGLGSLGPAWERLRLDGFIKAGIYYNHAKGTLLIPETGDSRPTSEKNVPAFLGEVGMQAVYRVTNHLSAKLGYQVMWLETVALAPDYIQLWDAPQADVDTRGGVFAHGLNFGIEFVY